jgi:hypothetical protein
MYLIRKIRERETWSPARLGNLVILYHQYRLPVTIPSTGDLLLVWNNNGKNEDRTPLDIVISADDGETCQQIKSLENTPKGSYCYTSIHFSGENVLLSYSSSEVKMGSVIKRMSLKWIYR